MKEHDLKKITVADVPQKIDFDRLIISRNECLGNAYQVSREYPEYDFVEGVIVLVDQDGGGTIMAHAWNMSIYNHFDITNTIWTDQGHNEVKEIRYHPVRSYSSDELPQGGIKFSEATNNLVAYQKIIFNWKFQPDSTVVLLDPVLKKPVNYGIIDAYDHENKVYHIRLQRLKNEFPFAWEENHIVSSTPKLIDEAEKFLEQIELLSDHLVKDYDIKNKPMETVITIPLSNKPYTLQYIQMNIDGAIKWRLLTLEGHNSR